MIGPELRAQRLARKPAEYTIVPCSELGDPLTVTHWIVQRRRVYWWRDDWHTTPVSNHVTAGHKYTETEARAEAALLNGETK